MQGTLFSLPGFPYGWSSIALGTDHDLHVAASILLALAGCQGKLAEADTTAARAGQPIRLRVHLVRDPEGVRD